MSAANYNMYIEQGTTFSLPLLIKTSGSPIDLTGYNFFGQIKETVDSSVVMNFTFTVENQMTNPGEVIVSLTKVQTSAIPSNPATASNPRPTKQYIYDIEMNSLANVLTRILQGTVTISPEVTT